jgi:hypothetical protein
MFAPGMGARALCIYTVKNTLPKAVLMGAMGDVVVISFLKAIKIFGPSTI